MEQREAQVKANRLSQRPEQQLERGMVKAQTKAVVVEKETNEQLNTDDADFKDIAIDELQGMKEEGQFRWNNSFLHRRLCGWWHHRLRQEEIFEGRWGVPFRLVKLWMSVGGLFQLEVQLRGGTQTYNTRNHSQQVGYMNQGEGVR